jgi:hypothetical protein
MNGWEISNVQYVHTYIPCMNGWGGGKSHVNNVKFKGTIIHEFHALGEEEEQWGAGVSALWIHLFLTLDSWNELCFTRPLGTPYWWIRS